MPREKTGKESGSKKGSLQVLRCLGAVPGDVALREEARSKAADAARDAHETFQQFREAHGEGRDAGGGGQDVRTQEV